MHNVCVCVHITLMPFVHLHRSTGNALNVEATLSMPALIVIVYRTFTACNQHHVWPVVGHIHAHHNACTPPYKHAHTRICTLYGAHKHLNSYTMVSSNETVPNRFIACNEICFATVGKWLVLAQTSMHSHECVYVCVCGSMALQYS